MNNIELNAKKREKKESVKNLRKSHILPGIVYGFHTSPVSVSINYNDFEKVYREAGSSQIFELVIDQKDKKNVLIQDIQKDPLKDTFTHVDFHVINMDEKITAKIPVKYKGTSSAVKDKGGILIKNVDELEIECLPHDLPHEILVDISGLQEINDSIRLSDLKGYEKIKIKADLNETLVIVAPPRTEKELASLEEKVEEKVEEVEGVKKEEKVEEGGGEQKGGKDEKADKAEKAKKD